MRKIPHGSEADNILVGEIDCIDHSIAAFIRLKNACYLGDLTEVPVPTRFLFVLLGPHRLVQNFFLKKNSKNLTIKYHSFVI